MNRLLKNSHKLLDSGNGFKLEQFGPYRLSRPCALAVWKPLLSEKEWQAADAFFIREGDAKWQKRRDVDDAWVIEVAGISFKISATEFGHLGIFPEQKAFWEWLPPFLQRAKAKCHHSLRVLNLFAYSGGSTLAAAKGGAEVCHLDASKGMVSWARENAALNQMEKAPIRWIVDDVNKFLARELRRGIVYDGIILDPPTFGRGAKGEIFKIEEHLQELLEKCKALLSPQPLFIFFSCHTPGFSPIVMQHLITQMMQGHRGTIDVGEMALEGDDSVLSLPSGVYGRWVDA